MSFVVADRDRTERFRSQGLFDSTDPSEGK
jgi:hypothetical protein